MTDLDMQFEALTALDEISVDRWIDVIASPRYTHNNRIHANAGELDDELPGTLV